MTELGAGLFAALVLAGCLCAGSVTVRVRRSMVLAAALGAIAAAIGAWLVRADPPREAILRNLMFHHHVVVDRPVAPAVALPLVLASAFATVAAWIAWGWKLVTAPNARVAPFALAVFVLAVRIALDKAAAPEWLAHACGLVTWSIALGPYLAARGLPVSRGAYWLSLATRVLVVALTVAATTLDLGTHFSLARVIRIALPFSDSIFVAAPGSFAHLAVFVLLPQLLLWPMLTAVLAGASAWIAKRAGILR